MHCKNGRIVRLNLQYIVIVIITEEENGYSFVYDKEYLNTPDVQPVSLTLPLREEPYVNNVMFSFFDGLIPEGWMHFEINQQNYLDVTENNRNFAAE